MLTAAREYYRLSELIARRAVAKVGAASSDRERVATVQMHQMAAAQASSNAFRVMLDEQDIDARAEQLLNSAAFTTETESMLAMLDSVQDDMGMDRLVASLVQDAGRAADMVGVVTRARIAHVHYLNPPSCSRCAVLAGRVYRWSTGFLRHPGCDCIMIPTTVANDQFVQDPVELMKQGLVTGLSKADREAILKGEDFNQVVNRHRTGLGAPGTAVRRRGRETIEEVLASSDDREPALQRLAEIGYVGKAKSPPTVSGDSGQGGSNLPPAVPEDSSDDVPDENDKAAWNAYWKRRQNALEGPNFTANGEVLQPDEVLFVERMVAKDERLSWIPTGSNGTDDVGTLPTNDFTWHNRDGMEVEHKALSSGTPVDLDHIARQVRNALTKNKRARTVDNVIVDIGDRDLTPGLLDDLRSHFAPPRKFSRLWVMSRGELIPIFTT